MYTPGEGEAAEVEGGEDSCGVDDREPRAVETARRENLY
jgi:hypothetical protein